MIGSNQFIAKNNKYNLIYNTSSPSKNELTLTQHKKEYKQLTQHQTSTRYIRYIALFLYYIHNTHNHHTSHTHNTYHILTTYSTTHSTVDYTVDCRIKFVLCVTKVKAKISLNVPKIRCT